MKKQLTCLALLLAAISLQAQVLYFDTLNYPNGNITSTSGGLWAAHSGTGTDSLEVSGRYEVNESRTTDVHRSFTPAASSGQLYASFTMRMTNLPSNGGGAYFAHFMDNGTEFRGRIFVLTNGALPGTFRVGVGNATADSNGTSGGPNQVLPIDMCTNLDYQVVMEYDIDNFDAILWLNPMTTSDPSAGPTGDVAVFTNGLSAFSFRQNTGEGVIKVSNLRVGQTFGDVVTDPASLAVFGLQPTPITNFVGNPMTLTVFASGKGNVTYQWFQNNGLLSGANSNIYTVASLSAGDQGNYYCQVTDAAGATNSSTVFVSVNGTPTSAFFTALPQNTTNAYGGIAKFSAAASGTGPLGYQWKIGAVSLSDGPMSSFIPGSTATISGSTTPNLTVSNLTKVDATNYTITVTGGAGSPTNATASLTVLPPAILVSGGSPYTQNFDTLASSGTGNAWSDGGTLPGWYASQTAGGGVVTTYRGLDGGGSGTFAGALYSFGTNGVNPLSDRALGSVASGTPGNFAYGFLFINDSPTLVVTNLALAYTGEQWRNGGNASTQSLTFSYRKSFTPINNSDAPSNSVWTPLPALSFNSPTVGPNATGLDGNAAANRVVIPAVLFTNITLLPGEEIFLRWFDLNDNGNDHGLAIDDLSLTFTTFTPPHTAPFFTQQPQNTTSAASSTASITAAVNGFQPMSFQWFKGNTPLTDGPTGNGSTISGSTNSPILTIANVLAADAGDYSVMVTNTLGSTNSATAHLTVIDPTITTQPVNVTNVVGDNGNFFAVGAGTTNFSAGIGYQWLSNDVPLPGANSNRLDFPVTTASAAANYQAVVTNANGASATSVVANIILVPTSILKIAGWDMNDTNSTATVNASLGTGTSTLLAGNTATFAPGTFADPASTTTTNTGWNTAAYPAAGTGNKTGGLQFTVSTVSNKDIMITW
ncbi:MAG TPA: immunoglobulin domain-containing protein, partial [Candidatus Dormibacteraeota bacterium]|nr:immunoglobulin domain-containing protein [Candidatus Dormibacteraeota bacterium]